MTAQTGTRRPTQTRAPRAQRAVEEDVPVLGLCFGGQMLARVLGSENYRSDDAEIGWLPVRTHDADLVSEGPWFQWHFDVFTAPPGARVVAETDVEAQIIDVRAMREMIGSNSGFATRVYRWLARGLSERLSRVAQFSAPPFCPE